MKLYNINNVSALFNVLDSCKGDVKLISKDGDMINLKSKLSQILLAAKLLDTSFIKELDLKVSDPEDMKSIMNFMMMSGSGEAVA